MQDKELDPKKIGEAVGVRGEIFFTPFHIGINI
jgi:hypothetical protein